MIRLFGCLIVGDPTVILLVEVSKIVFLFAHAACHVEYNKDCEHS